MTPNPIGGASTPDASEMTISLIIATAAGLWIFLAFLFLMRRTKKLNSLRPSEAPAPAVSDEEKAKATAALARAKKLKALAWFLVFVGLVVLLGTAGYEIEPIRLATNSWWASAMTEPSRIFVLAAWILPGLYLFAVLLTSEGGKPDEPSRTKYLDAMKTLITASGLTIGVVISTSLKPTTAPPGWTETVRYSVVALAICIGCSVTTLFILSYLYDKTGDKVVPWQRLLLAIPFAYFALVTFFLGFIRMVHLTYLL